MIERIEPPAAYTSEELEQLTREILAFLRDMAARNGGADWRPADHFRVRPAEPEPEPPP